MTAIVGILNKRAAVMAADSAVTVSNAHGTKIYNTATKIFRLSREHPVGVMIFDSSYFMETPWDLIFKLYRDRRGSQGFNTLDEYVRNFLNFLSSEDYFSGPASQGRYLQREIQGFYYKVSDYVQEVLEQKIDDGEMSDEEVEAECRKVTLERIGQIVEAAKERGECPELESYTLSHLKSFARELLDDWAQVRKEDSFPEEFGGQFEEGFLAYLRSQLFFRGTGLVFVGYGEKDIYPQLITIYISGAFDRRLRYYYSGEDENVSIGDDNSSTIMPFAQVDVMLTLMKGIHPTFRRYVEARHSDSLNEAREKILAAMKEAGCSKKQMAAIEALELTELTDKYEELMDDFSQNEFVDGIVDAVNSFNVEDMVNMAESLVSVTNLQRHISSSEESVGGPIDVAVITRSEGFMWAKHKSLLPQGRDSE